MAEIVATTSLPVDRLTATDCNAAARANYEKPADVIFHLLHLLYPQERQQLLARAAALQSVAVRRSTCNDVSGLLFSPLFFPPFFLLRHDLFS